MTTSLIGNRSDKAVRQVSIRTPNPKGDDPWNPKDSVNQMNTGMGNCGFLTNLLMVLALLPISL
ncbi:MAG TPA: hypothetical protein VFH42_00080 [Sporolactobacillaceae bacterium]|nr:hypothetical protein [Sporolactobacillaceae bacterium]